MDNNAKHATSYQLDQEILDARGINMTVEEVCGLPTSKYAEKVHELRLSKDDHAFLKGLRRRIKNRLASQNSRRRNMEHLRRLSRELRAVRARRGDAAAERRALLALRGSVALQCRRLRDYVAQVLQDRSDASEVPSIDITDAIESHNAPALTTTNMAAKTESYVETFECRIDKLVQNSVNHIYNRRLNARTVFFSGDQVKSDYSDVHNEFKVTDVGVLNLSLKKRSHGRKQSAPRRVAYAFSDYDDGVLNLKIKKENQ